MLDVLRGKYRIVREIARSNDIVYEATDVSLGRRVALKELNIAQGVTGQAKRERIERFTREARAAGRLNHPNIVSIYDFGEENDRHFIAMEYLEGQNLRDVLQVRGALPLKEAVDIACMVLDALDFAHNNKVIHRDIKPDNIQILPGGQVKLTDFGIARLTEEPQLTSNGQVFGTPSYMSPEQIEGKSIDYRSDLFSVGVVLYEMLAGRKPFQGDSVVSITYAIMNAEPPQLVGVPMGIENVIRKALAKQPQGRPITAAQMKADLRNAEQTPQVFLQNGGMNNTGYNLAAMGGGMMGGSSLPQVYTGQNGGYSPAPAAINAAPPPVNLPWGWNGAAANGAAVPQQNVPVMNGAGNNPLLNAGAYAAPPLPARPPEPLLILTPEMKKFFLVIGAVILLSGSLALGITSLWNGYENYQRNFASQHIIALINESRAAYDARDYAKAVKLLEQAADSKPSGENRETVNFNLTQSYIQLARVEMADGKLKDAKDHLDKAIKVSPDNRQAHQDLAKLLDLTGNAPQAAQERQKAADAVPDESSELKTAVKSEIPEDPGESPEDRRQRAWQKMRDADALIRNGDRDGALKALREAEMTAPGTDAYTAAEEMVRKLGNN